MAPVSHTELSYLSSHAERELAALMMLESQEKLMYRRGRYVNDRNRVPPPSLLKYILVKSVMRDLKKTLDASTICDVGRRGVWKRKAKPVKRIGADARPPFRPFRHPTGQEGPTPGPAVPCGNQADPDQADEISDDEEED